MARSLLLAVLAAALAHPQGGAPATLPACMLQCRPYAADDFTYVCEVTCVASEVVLDSLAAADAGEPYFPRFTDPFGECETTCPFGAETFEYAAGETVPLQVGLWSTATDDWFGISSTVLSVELFVAPVVSVLTEEDVAALPWTSLGFASPSVLTGFWRASWDTAAYGDPAGYLLRADVVDVALGTLDAFTFAWDADACGYHPYGTKPSPPGANLLELVGTGTACPGSAAIFTTSGVGGATLVGVASTGGDVLPLLGGTVWVDLLGAFLVESLPAGGPVVSWSVSLPALPGLPGLSFFVQTASLPEPSAPAGVALSNGVRLDVCACP